MTVAMMVSPEGASARPRATSVPLLGASEVLRVTTPTGFIDDVVTGDADRLVHVVADGSAKAALHVVTLVTGQEQIVDVSAVTLQPTTLQLVGSRVFVVGRAADGQQVAALF